MIPGRTSYSKRHILSVSKGIQKKKEQETKPNQTQVLAFTLPMKTANWCNVYSQGKAPFLPFSLGEKDMNAAVVGQELTVDLERTSQKSPKQINSIETSAAVLLEFHIKT